MPSCSQTVEPGGKALLVWSGKYLYFPLRQQLSTPVPFRNIRKGEDGLTDKKPGAPPGDEIVRVKLPQKRNREMFGCAELMMGANHIRVRGFDGVTRMGRIKGKIKKKVWIREGDILIIIPWTFQDEKCDIIYRYTGPQVEWLRRNNYL